MAINIKDGFELIKLVTSSWKRLILSIIFLSFSFTSYIVWSERVHLLQFATAKYALPKIDLTRIDTTIDELYQTTGADSVSIWAASPAADTKRAIVVSINKVRHKNVENILETYFPDDPLGREVAIDLLHGEVVCTEVPMNSGIKKELDANKITWRCMVGIPPDAVNVTVGVISIGFKVNPEGRLPMIKANLRHQAAYLVNQGGDRIYE